MTPDSAIQLMLERILAGFKPQRVILFGSHALGTANQDSDVDLLIEFEHIANKRELAVEIRRALGDLPVAKDIIVTTREEVDRRGDIVGGILWPALHEGRVLYERG